MPIEPATWNVVINGAWNTAILSPDGIRRRLFELPEHTPVDLEMALDRPGLFRVKHEGMQVAPTPRRLEIGPVTPTPGLLESAARVAQRALISLPETPVTSAGVNIRYRDAELPGRLIEDVSARLDGALADREFRIQKSEMMRSLELAPGVVNLLVRSNVDGSGAIEFNFHRESSIPAQLSEWVARTAEFVAVSNRLLEVMGVPLNA